MRRLVITRDDHWVAHDGSAGVSPEGWLPDRVSVGALTRALPPELVDQVVATTDTRELRRRLLPARLVVYFVLALWLFRGPNCGYGRVMVKLVEPVGARNWAHLMRPADTRGALRRVGRAAGRHWSRFWCAGACR
jgi:Insertion element 4 transposase N-terminal